MNDLNQEQVAKQKRQRMTAVIVVIMVAILLVWVLNFKNFLDPVSVKKPVSVQEGLSWAELKSRFDSTMKQVSGKLNAIDKDKTAVVATSTISSTTDPVKDLIINLNGQLASTSASSTASSSDIQAAQIKSKLNSLEDQLKRNNP